jgi:hypothetical protein
MPATFLESRSENSRRAVLEYRCGVNIPRPMMGIALPLFSLIPGTSSGLTIVVRGEWWRKRNARTRGRMSKRNERRRNEGVSQFVT